MIPYKYSQLTERIDYLDAVKQYHPPKFHLGQLKLFFTELFFLSTWAKDGNKVLYVGAANGYHIGKLAELFPKLNFDLWDPGKFEVKETNQIKIYRSFFTDDVARKYIQDGPNILFMCDIRTIKIAKFKKEHQIGKIDELVEDDMDMQKRWIQIINPIYAYLKFRLPYEIPQSSYLVGPIYLQPYSPFSTETRLMTNDYATEILYDSKEFDDKLAYFNFITRQNIRSAKWAKFMKKYNIKNCWDNALALYITQLYLTNMKGIKSKEETVKLFLDIIKYHQDRYGDKYDIIFEKKS